MPSDEQPRRGEGGRSSRRTLIARTDRGRSDQRRDPARPEPDELQERLTELYKEMPAEELTRQGRAHLAKDSREKVRRSVYLGWVVAWTMILGGLILIGAFSLWLLFMARKNGTSFAHMRQQAMSAYTTDE